MSDYDATQNYPRVQGECPMGCGSTLFVGAGGWITCSYIQCPDPTRVSDMLPKIGNRSVVVIDGKVAVAQDVVTMWLDGEDQPEAWQAFVDAAREVADRR